MVYNPQVAQAWDVIFVNENSKKFCMVLECICIKLVTEQSCSNLICALYIAYG